MLCSAPCQTHLKALPWLPFERSVSTTHFSLSLPHPPPQHWAMLSSLPGEMTAAFCFLEQCSGLSPGVNSRWFTFWHFCLFFVTFLGHLPKGKKNQTPNTMLCISISSSIEGYSSVWQTPFNFEPGCWQVDAAALASSRKCSPGPVPEQDTGAQLQESCRCAAIAG